MISHLASYLPAQVLDNHALAQAFPEWTAEQIVKKTGIVRRHIAARNECASDLAFQAATTLLSSTGYTDVDFLLFCTQSPDYLLPTSACLLQFRLGLATTCGALDFNLGCSGFIYGLSLAHGLLGTGQANKVLLATADTYSKMLAKDDKSTRALFGDAGVATLVSCTSKNQLSNFVFGTDGSGGKLLINEGSGFRGAAYGDNGSKLKRSVPCLRMDGPEIYNFTLRAVPMLIAQVCKSAGLQQGEIDYFIFHQANAFMLEALRRKLGIAPEKFELSIANYGNTVSSTIPLAIVEAQTHGRLRPGMKVLLAGFGVGLSWAGCILTVNENIVIPSRNPVSAAGVI
jgi:3-oxoacyl-[acyl-carrier-protein] synthase-3